MQYIRYKLLLTLFALLCPLFVISAESSTTNILTKNVYVPAKLVKGQSPNYPAEELDKGNTGIVEITFMIDQFGKTFEPIINRSSKPIFEPYALLAIQGYRYKPATLNNKAVESVKKVRVVFLVGDQDDYVTPRFKKNYKSAIKELKKEKPNNKKIAKKIKAMEKSNELSPYSYRHLNSIKHEYAKLFSDKQAQIDAIYDLLLFEARTKHASGSLGLELRIKMRRLLVSQLIQTGQYGSAVDEYAELKRIDRKAKSLFREPFKKIKALQKNDEVVKREIRLNARGFKSVPLFKNTFNFSGENKIDQLKLRCESKFKAVDYKADSDYKIPSSWGECFLQIIGKPGSKIELYQL